MRVAPLRCDDTQTSILLTPSRLQPMTPAPVTAPLLPNAALTPRPPLQSATHVALPATSQCSQTDEWPDEKTLKTVGLL